MHDSLLFERAAGASPAGVLCRAQRAASRSAALASRPRGGVGLRTELPLRGSLQVYSIAAPVREPTVEQGPSLRQEVSWEAACKAIGSRAVVVGAGLSGLASTRVLSDLFDEVVLIERDAISTEPDVKRGGVPQYGQPHAFLARGLEVCNKLWPGFSDELVARGAQRIDWLKDCRFFDYGSYMQRVPREEWSPLDCVSSTRAMVEQTARARVLAIPNVSLRSGTVVSSLTFSQEKSLVTGVQLKGGELLPADFVVEASGRNSLVPDWLAEAGFQSPKVETITSGLGYGSRTYKIPDGWLDRHDWLAASFANRPNAVRQGLLMPVEHGRWQLILTGRAGDHPPTDEAGYQAFAASLARSDIADAIAEATPLGPVMRYSRTENLKRHYEQVDMPGGLAVVGDAACSFNPIYGQGMTVGILGAEALGRRLRQLQPATNPTAHAAALKRLTKEFQAELAQLQEFPWGVATQDDLQHLANTGKIVKLDKTPAQALVLWYFGLVIRAAMVDYRINRKLVSVTHLVTPPSTLFAPEIILAAARILARDTRVALLSRLRGGRTAPATLQGSP